MHTCYVYLCSLLVSSSPCTYFCHFWSWQNLCTCTKLQNTKYLHYIHDLWKNAHLYLFAQKIPKNAKRRKKTRERAKKEDYKRDSLTHLIPYSYALYILFFPAFTTTKSLLFFLGIVYTAQNSISSPFFHICLFHKKAKKEVGETGRGWCEHFPCHLFTFRMI